MKVIFASNNSGKIRELQTLLQKVGIQIIPQSELDIPEADETGLSFVENAILKARNAAKMSGLPAIADDSGLEVDFLKGSPGIYSARYAGEKATSQDNIKKLLAELQTVPEEKRTARFYCALVYMNHATDPTPIICQGSWQGSILHSPQGDDGFGYDPVFYLTQEQCSAAELSLDKKNRLSHRGQALAQLVARLLEKNEAVS